MGNVAVEARHCKAGNACSGKDSYAQHEDLRLPYCGGIKSSAESSAEIFPNAQPTVGLQCDWFNPCGSCNMPNSHQTTSSDKGDSVETATDLDADLPTYESLFASNSDTDLDSSARFFHTSEHVTLASPHTCSRLGVNPDCISGVQPFHAKRRQIAQKQDNNSLSGTSRTAIERLTIVKQRAGYRCGRLHFPECIIRENIRSAPSIRNMTTKDGSIDYLMLPVVTRSEAKDILKNYAKKIMRCDTKEAKMCKILNIQPDQVFRYRLSTLTESRRVRERTEFFTGQHIDDEKEYSPAQQVREMSIQCPSGYGNETKNYKIPHTSAIKKCTSCDGTVCEHCNRGRNVPECTSHSSGKDADTYRIICNHCTGNGRIQCGNCGGNGAIRCAKCNGNKIFVQYNELVVTRKTITNTYVEGYLGLSEEHLSDPKGAIVLVQEGENLEPVRPADLLHENICYESKKYLKLHNSGSANKVKQRQIVDVLPVTEVHYSYHGKKYQFFLLGLDRRVHAPHYPHKTKWGCRVM